MKGIKVRSATPLDLMEETRVDNQGRRATLSSSLRYKTVGLPTIPTQPASSSDTDAHLASNSNHPTPSSGSSRLSLDHDPAQKDRKGLPQQQANTHIINNNSLPPLLSRDSLNQRIKSINSKGRKKSALKKGSSRYTVSSGSGTSTNIIVHDAKPLIEEGPHAVDAKDTKVVTGSNRTILDTNIKVEVDRIAGIRSAFMPGFSGPVEYRKLQWAHGTCCSVLHRYTLNTIIDLTKEEYIVRETKTYFTRRGKA